MSTTKSFFPPMPKTGINFPDSPLLQASLEHSRKYTNLSTVNHCLRSASFAFLLSRRHPALKVLDLDMELIVYSALMHDLGWSPDQEFISADKRFEVDGANLARQFLVESPLKSTEWNKHRLQLSWDAIALHATPSIAFHKEPEVLALALGISADFLSRDPPFTQLITDEEHREIVEAFPRVNFTQNFVDIMCRLCREKPETTFDNMVGGFGCVYGTDGKGTGKEEFAKKLNDSLAANVFSGSLARCAAVEDREQRS